MGKSFGQTPPTKDHVRSLLEITGSGKVGIQVMGSMITSYKKSMPSVPDVFWDDFLKSAKPEALIDLMIPIYAKYYTDEEIVQLIAFYKTPLGKSDGNIAVNCPGFIRCWCRMGEAACRTSR